MARLISDEDVKELINGLDSLPWEEEVDDLVAAISTAYDVEKVVEELESLRIDKSNYFGVLNVVAEKYDRANEMLNDAIDIVRRGGLNE